ncbi:hypothetical protein T484DRAFT_3388406 [Baffinella frigidus]|nr:hypothetical protein T484DRAFT_3388406 [Cryptophyta sp. CCMP2293]
MAIASSSRRLLALALALAACGLVLLATGLSGPARRAALVSDPDTALEMPAAGVHTIAKTQRRQYKLAAAAPAAHMHPSQLTLPARASKLGLADRIRQAVRDAAAKAKAAVEAVHH